MRRHIAANAVHGFAALRRDRDVEARRLLVEVAEKDRVAVAVQAVDGFERDADAALPPRGAQRLADGMS